MSLMDEEAVVLGEEPNRPCRTAPLHSAGSMRWELQGAWGAPGPCSVALGRGAAESTAFDSLLLFAVLPWPLIKFQFEVLRHVQCSNTFEKSRPSFVRKLMLLVREKQLSVPLFCCSSLTIGLILMLSLCSKTSLVSGN